MIDLFEKSIETLELPRVLEMLSAEASTQEGKERCLSLRPHTDPDDVERALAETTAAVDLVAAGYSAQVLRLERDGEAARTLYRALPWLRDGAFAAARIAARMGATGEKLEALAARTPRFSAWKREVPLHSSRGQVMQALLRETGVRPDGGEGIRVRRGNGWVYLTPMARRAAVRVLAEGPDLETAAELCDFFAGETARLDRDLSVGR